VQFRCIRNVALSAILCAALAPAIVGAATLRMVVQSHPNLGGKCLDVPNAQFVAGMRLQMWDCNNGRAQIFSYDETSQQLRIGNLCVESWGRGDPQDAVGLGSCNGGAKQHWKMVASNDYYQIIGINNRCLELRYGLKDNGAALDIQDCDATKPHRIWALLEAPPENPPAPNIAGDWTCSDHCAKMGGVAKIFQTGGSLTLVNEINCGTTGSFETETRIRAVTSKCWTDDLRGELQENNNVIKWTNGTIWRRSK